MKSELVLGRYYNVEDLLWVFIHLNKINEMPLECLFVYPQSLKLHWACVLRYTVYLKMIFLSHYCESSHMSGGSDTESILY